jgi:hypothetical protein
MHPSDEGTPLGSHIGENASNPSRNTSCVEHTWSAERRPEPLGALSMFRHQSLQSLAEIQTRMSLSAAAAASRIIANHKLSGPARPKRSSRSLQSQPLSAHLAPIFFSESS